MGVRIEVLPFLGVALGFGVIILLICKLCKLKWTRAITVGTVIAVIFSLYFLWFFRDPNRTPPDNPSVVVAAADGKVAQITDIARDRFESLCRTSGLDDKKMARLGRLLETDSVRISIFLSLVDVHVNRAPISGMSDFLGYFPGKRHFTFDEKSSEENQHNAIFMQNEKTCCLINQIVGPVARRVVYWPDKDKPVELKIGDRIGMMKFGSRLDMYFPKGDIDIKVKVGDRVAAGTSVIAIFSQGE